MANEKLTAIRVAHPFVSPIADDDLFYTVQDTGTTPAERAITGAELKEEIRSNPIAILGRTAVQSIPDSSNTAIVWDSELSDLNTMHSLGTNPSRITVPIDGIYLITAGIFFAGDATGIRSIKIYQGGNVKKVMDKPVPSTGGDYLEVTSILTASANDYFEIYVWQAAGHALDAGGVSLYLNQFSVALLRQT